MEGILSRSYEGGSIPLARPLAPGVSSVNLNDPAFSDLAGALTGVKPVTYTDCSPERAPRLKDLCGKLGLRYLPVEEFLGRESHHQRRGKRIYLIGRDLKILKAAALAWKDPENNERWAGILGYPECCILMFSKWLKTLGRGPDLVEMSYRNTPEKEKLDFRLNNVCNYSSRIHHNGVIDRRNFEKFTAFNRRYIFHALHVIGWHPCSYACRESLKKAAVIFSFMRHHAPDYAATLQAALAKPVLFWGKFRFAFLEGRVAGESVFSSAVSLPRSLLEDRKYRLLAFSEEIRLGRKRAEFLREGAPPLFSRSFRPIVLNFVK